MKRIAQTLSLRDDKDSFVVAVAVALLISVILFGYYYIAIGTPPKDYLTLYLLNTQRRADVYPELLIVGENNTFNVYFTVENHMNTSKLCEVQIKVTDKVNPNIPLNTSATQIFRGNIEVEAKWEEFVTVSLDKAGNFSVIFELWVIDEFGVLEFSGEFCVLKIQVVDSLNN